MTALIGKKIINLSEVDSTNNYAMQKCMPEMWLEGTVVIAQCQMNGKGQALNSWESEPLKNLTLSIVFSPNFLSPTNQFMLSKVVSLGIAETVNSYVENVSIKWPNDIYVGNKKVAGILIENIIVGSSFEYSVVGIGLNVNQSVFKSNAPNPISLSQLTNTVLDIDEVKQLLFRNIEKWYLLLKHGNHEKINNEFQSLLYKFEIESQFSDDEGMFFGKIIGVSPIGLLRIKRENGVVSEFQFKQVKYIL